MSFTAQEVITGARAWHPSFAEKVHGNTVAFDWLNSFIRVERRKLQSLVPEMLLAQITIDLPLSVFSEGGAIPDAEQVHTVSALTEAGDLTRGDQVALVPLEHFNDYGVWPACSWLGGGVNRLYLKGSASEWLDYSALLVNYVPIPVAITALEAEILLPDTLLDVCVTGLAVFFGFRSPDLVNPRQMQYLMQKETEARNASDSALAAQRAGEVFRTRELF